MNMNDDNQLRSVTTSDDEHSTENDPAAIVTHSSRPLCVSILLWLVFVIFMVINIGISLLPAIFFGNPAAMPYITLTNASNHSVLPPRPPHFPCNPPLKKNPALNNICDVPCAWNQLTTDQNTAKNIVDNISLIISLLGFVFILLTWISMKKLRVFPNIIPLHIQGTSSVISLMIVIGNAMTTKDAFCSHEFLSQSMKHPTVFCVAQGVLIQYFSNVCALWFIVYSICLVQMIFSKNVIDPSHTSKWHHVISAAFCYLLPWILVGVVFKNSGYGMVSFGRICLPRNNDLTYYTNTMITEIGLGVGCSCLIVVVFKLFRLRNLDVVQAEQSKKRKSRMDKIAIRLVCLMFAYAICSSLVYIPICVANRNKKLLEFYFKQYVGCLFFYPAQFCEKYRVEFENHTNANTFIISYLSSGLFTISTVCFLAFNRQSRRLWTFWWQRVVDCCCLPEEEQNEPSRI